MPAISAITVMGVLRSHGRVVVNGVMLENPFFLSQQAYLGQVPERERS